MDIKVRLYLLENGDKFMGIGVYWLLRGIRSNGSLRKAALELDLSYSKAFRMISDLERALDCRVLDRHHGGQSRDGAVLTEFGEEFILLFERFQNRSEQLVRIEFKAFAEELEALERRCGKAVAKEARDDTEEV